MSSRLAASLEWARFARELGMQLRRARSAQEMTQEQIAELAEISLYAYQQYERGSTTKDGPATNPRLATILSICRALDVELTDILPPVPPVSR